jgi:prophage regulatory protein
MAPFRYGREQSNVHQLPETGYLRLPQIIGDPNADPPIPAVIPVGRSTWWEGVKSGRFPRPVKLGPRITAWRVEDIRALIQELQREVRHDG